MRRKDITDKKFGRLTARCFSHTENKGSTHRSVWKCECECGQFVKIKLHELTSGDTKSCGCYKSDLNIKRCFKGVGEVTRDCWSSIKRGAASRSIEFNISIEYMWELFEIQNGRCALTGEEVKLSHNRKKIKPTASLDRIDSSIGYVEGNVQWVHKQINLCKHTLNNKEFMDMCAKVVNWKDNRDDS